MENEEIKISVIVPIFNENNEYLEKCISSICDQTHKNIEIILVDDGSTAPCSKICDIYGRKDKRVKVFHKENGGSQSARRMGIEAASGDYVAFVDSDDWIETGLYEKMAEVIVRDHSDMLVASNYYRNYADGTELKATDNRREGFWKDSEFEKEVFPYFIRTEDYFDTEFPAAMWSYLFKTEFARMITKKIPNSIKIAEDYTFLMIAYLNAKFLSAITYRGYHYRSNVNSKTHTIRNVKELLYPVYKTVDCEISKSNYNHEVLKNKNKIFIFHSLMLRDYENLFNMEMKYLFPYSDVIKGSRVIIYGAGKLGKQIYGAIKKNSDYTICGIADRNWKSYKEQELNVISPKEIMNYEFDYVIIAVTYVNVRKEVKKSLIEIGVPENKFAEIDMKVMDDKHLPFY